MSEITRGHSPLGMSVLERRYACPGSMRMEQGRVDRPSSYATRGTALHAVAATCLNEGSDAWEVIPDDADGIEIVQTYLNVVRNKHVLLGGDLLVEHMFSLETLDGRYWGTADCVIIAPPVIWVADLKTGGGHLVPVRRPDGRVNFQPGGYGLGALQTVPPGVVITNIELCIVQPRRDALLETSMSVDEVLDLAGDLANIARAVNDPDAVLVAGEHCAFCRARGECPALREQALERARVDFAELPVPLLLTPAELGEILTRADMIDLWVASVRDHAKGLADSGGNIPGWKLVAKRGQRRWVDDAVAEESLDSAGLKPSEFLNSKVISPTQAEKALKRLKLKRPDTWSDLVTTTDPGTALVPDADARPALLARPPALDFKHEEHST